ncbi:MAG: hypothetical protein J0H04_07360, partial [Hyphomicrobium denitrificans]|nr:hypothetical protein [Hyphomicrobium denitrificans]
RSESFDLTPFFGSYLQIAEQHVVAALHKYRTIENCDNPENVRFPNAKAHPCKKGTVSQTHIHGAILRCGASRVDTFLNG